MRRHLLVPRRPHSERTARLLLIALASDRAEGYPDNVAATARRLGVSRPAVRAWRDSLVTARLLQRTAGGLLQPGPAWPEFERQARAEFEARGLVWGWDSLPRRMVGRLTPNALFAAAVLHGECVARVKRFVRSDGERAELANVSRATVRAARDALEREGMSHVEHVRRGRMRLTRMRFDERASHGSPMSLVRAANEAARAAAGRVAAAATALLRGRGGGNSGTRAGGNSRASHHQFPTGNVHHQGSREPVRVAADLSIGSDGQFELPLPARAPSRTPDADAAAARQRVEGFLASRAAVARVCSLPAESGCRQVLQLAGCFTTSARKLRDWPKQLAARWGRDAVALLVGAVADVAAGVRKSRVRSIGAVLAGRLPRVLAHGDARSEGHRRQPIGRLLARFERGLA